MLSFSSALEDLAAEHSGHQNQDSPVRVRVAHGVVAVPLVVPANPDRGADQQNPKPKKVRLQVHPAA